MPIVFDCPGCGTQLRTPDNSVGKEARCPTCKSIALIPNRPFRDDPPTPPPESSPAVVSRPDSGNPYQSPVSDQIAMSAPSARTGPAWEREGKSFRSFAVTVIEGLLSPGTFFRTLRREGDAMAPVWFAIAGAYLTVLSLYMMATYTGADRLVIGSLLFQLVVLPIGMLVSLSIVSGVTHLVVVAGRRQRPQFSVTQRVVAYSFGTTAVLAAIPCFGALVAMFYFPAILAIGLAKTEQASLARSILAAMPITIWNFGLFALFIAAALEAR